MLYDEYKYYIKIIMLHLGYNIAVNGIYLPFVYTK
ncbi:hypothetical protein Niako_6717 [Niastella koreensis GR20-10]|uniref:Uncharacterized protein n=1 Tax=Niastella koreensis (strain DSM 17620 / KACC 11465 / NBRC 106392 / GR20-10) TaxID=700598 RepID=G8TK03_NIAKG|nr:hypothetical protein Niako_6717 [Niastella koreensis GR20-10]